MPNHASQAHPESRTHTFLSLLLALALLAVVLIAPIRLAAQTPLEIVGRVEGRDFTIEVPASAPTTVGDAANVLASGSRLIVRSGQARIALNGGGEIIICGAARLQLLKSQDALTIALDFGTLRVHVEHAEPVALFTPLVTATPIAIGGGARDTTIGLDQNGQMCLRAVSGAVRVAQQLSGESLLVPQFGGLTLSGGQLTPVAATTPGCSCELDTAKLSPVAPLVTHEMLGVVTTSVTKSSTQVQPAPSEDKQDKPSIISNTTSIAPPLAASGETSKSSVVDAPPSLEVPTYRVLMPALIFNSKGPEPPLDPSPETIVLVRSVQVREDTIFHGTVEPKGKHEGTPPVQADSAAAKPHQGVFARIGGFFRRVFGASTGPDCAGAGCK